MRRLGSLMSGPGEVAEADGNRTRQRQHLSLDGFEDRAGHQTGDASLGHGDNYGRHALPIDSVRARWRLRVQDPARRAGGRGGPVGAAAPHEPAGELLVGLDSGDDAAAVVIEGGTALIVTTDFFTPVVDDPYDWGRIAAANALSDVYAMGGRPVVAVNLLGWPRDVLPLELAAETLRGGLDVCSLAGCHLAGGHSVDDPEPKYGLAVTGIADPNRLLRNDSGKPGTPLSLTKPLGIGVLNSRHKATGERFADAVAAMTTLNAEAAAAALAAGIECATDVTGFGLLGHLHKLARASGVTAVIDSAAVPYLDGARAPGRRLRQRRHPAQSRVGGPARRPVGGEPAGGAPAGRRADLGRTADRGRDSGRTRYRRVGAPRGAHDCGARDGLELVGQSGWGVPAAAGELARARLFGQWLL
ncbi:hypothetical protein NIIDMKKI_00060 [Mycobacterium kansasii]|uniref:Selenide, water dikinase n=1 Tax=Mycobacterium kansasii TaxID=1768 RepID=A0A7G1I158_MYCKA|nr:hypothetical protein NIIDMKKI_00060 [Mycobacterium kansasii]